MDFQKLTQQYLGRHPELATQMGSEAAAARYVKAQLENAAPYFQTHKATDLFYSTSNGMVFKREKDATNHASELPFKKVLAIHRVDLVEEAELTGEGEGELEPGEGEQDGAGDGELTGEGELAPGETETETPEPEADEETETEAPEANYSEMTVAELKKELDAKGIEYAPKEKKAGLIALLEAEAE